MTRMKEWAAVRPLKRRRFAGPLKIMFEEQEEKCAICRDWVVRPQIDHDHETGYIRGLLCNSCNMALGGYEKFRRLDLLGEVEKYITKSHTLTFSDLRDHLTDLPAPE